MLTHIKLTKTKGAFPNENSLLKLLYMGILLLAVMLNEVKRKNAEKNGLCQLEIEILHSLNFQFFLK